MAKTKIYGLQNLQQTLSALSPDVFVVAFYVNNTNVSQDIWMNPLAARMRAAGYLTVAICTPQNVDRVRIEADIAAVVAETDFTPISRVNIIIISDMDTRNAIYPLTTKILGCRHAFSVAQDNNLPWSTAESAGLDGWMVPFPLSADMRTGISELWTGFTTPAGTRRRGNFHIIPVGYPGLAVLAEQLRAHKSEPDSIVYAPVERASYPDYGGNRLQRYGVRTVRTLLNSFPDYRVIFRPYKLDLDSPEVGEICAAFTDEPRFLLDTSPERDFSFARGALLVTDLSHIAWTFAFSTLRPALYFQPWLEPPQQPIIRVLKRLMNSFRPKEKTPQSFVTWECGFSAYSFPALVTAAKDCLEKRDVWQKNLRTRRDRLTMPFDTALDDIVAFTTDLIKDKPHPEWLTIPRDGTVAQSEAELIRRMLQQPRAPLPNLSASALMCNSPFSPLLAAFALHAGRVIIPETVLYFQDAKPIERAATHLLGKELSGTRYKDVDARDVRALYGLAIREMIEKKDADGLAVAEALLKHFNACCEGACTPEFKMAFPIPAPREGTP